MYKYILIPGRHHVLSNYMHEYFAKIASSKTVTSINSSSLQCTDDLCFIWAVTSANHENTRRNPLPNYRREAGLESFSSDFLVPSLTYHIKNIRPTARFADYLIKSIEVESQGNILLTPENTIIASSTPSVIDQFEELNYQIAPIELVDRNKIEFGSPRAWDLVMAIANAGEDWKNDPIYAAHVHQSYKNILERYDLGGVIVELHSDPLVGDDGDITETRDYEVYRASFDQGAERKYNLLSSYIRPGRIVDIGCATGSLIKEIDQDERFFESDLFGVEVARPLYEYCMQRLHRGDYKNENTFFYQRNIMRGKLFPDSSVDTTISISLTHEIDSYLGRDSLKQFIDQIYKHTAVGGVYLNLDVTCPEEPDKPVLLWLDHQDGIDDDGSVYDRNQQSEYKNYLEKLSTLGRFKRFIRDFRTLEGDGISPESIELFEHLDKWYARLRNADAVEFITTKDYLDSWYSEMHERFCYWPPSVWKEELEKVGFEVDPQSGGIQNEWIINNRFDGRVALYEDNLKNLIQLPWPDTSVLMIAYKN